MSNGGVLGRRNVPGVDGFSGVWSLREIANATRKRVWPDYFTKALALGPEALWRLDETSGTTAIDSSGNGHHGTFSGSYALGVSGIILGGFKAAAFTGGHVAVPALGAALTSWSIGCYARLNSTTGSRTFLSNDLGGFNNDVLFGLHPEPSITTTARIAGDHQEVTTAVRTIATDTVDAAVGDIYNSFIVSDGSVLKLYVNGVERASTPKTGSALTFGDNPIRLANNPQGSRALNGTLQGVVIYPFALSPEQIASLYSPA